MDVKVQTSDGEIYSLELELDQDDTVNSLVSQVSACLASVSTGTLKTSSHVSNNGAQRRSIERNLGQIVDFVLFRDHFHLPAIVENG